MFYENLRILCAKKGISVTALVKALGLSNGNLSKWKNGGRPRADTAQKIADYLGIKLDELFKEGGEEEARERYSEIRYALYHETADMSDDTLERVLEFARFAKAQEKRKGQK